MAAEKKKPSPSVAAEKKKPSVTADQKALQKAPKASEFVDVILKKCKEHGGPVTETKKLNQMTSKFNECETRHFHRQENQL